MKRLILVDGAGLIYRGFYAIPQYLKNPATGELTNAVFGFSNILLSLLTTYKPDYLAVAFDKKGPTFRHEAFKEYKATRVPAPQALYDQIPRVKEIVEAFQIPLFEVGGFEADDVLATIAEQLKEEKDIELFIATGDFDLFQVVSGKTHILYPAKGLKEAELLDAEKIYEKYGLLPSQISDYKGLAGDTSDNIPGVKGIGEKTAKDLLQRYKTLEGVYQHINDLPVGVGKKLEEGKEDAYFCKKLALLERHVPLSFSLSACRVKKFDIQSVLKIFHELGFKSLAKRLEAFTTEIFQGTLF